MNVVMTGNGKFVEIQGTGEEAVFTKKEMDELIKMAQKGIRELTKIQRKFYEKEKDKTPKTIGYHYRHENMTGRFAEIRQVLRGLELRIYSLNDFPKVPEIEEDGKSFAENALKKARFYSTYFGKLTLADDSGLEVDGLNGLPGIYSARYAAKEATNQENNQKLLREMEGVPLSKRGARFQMCDCCCIS